MIAWLALPALAAPTHAGMDSASWTVLSTAREDDAGEVVLSHATVDGVDCYRGVGETDLAPSKLLSVVTDVEGATRWSTAGITEARLLGRSGNHLMYYQYLDLPAWTLSADRFWFVDGLVTEGGDQSSLRWSLMPGGGAYGEAYQKLKADHPDAIEPSVNVGSWQFTRREDRVAVTYSVCTLGGSIPAAIQSAATRKTLPATIGDVIREARRR